MSINASGWRPEAPVAGGKASPTVTGNKGLMLEEALIFEIGDSETTGVDFASSPSPLRGEGRVRGEHRHLRESFLLPHPPHPASATPRLTAWASLRNPLPPAGEEGIVVPLRPNWR